MTLDLEALKSCSLGSASCGEQRRALIAERDQLRVELRKFRDLADAHGDRLMRERDAERSEADQLRVEVERLAKERDEASGRVAELSAALRRANDNSEHFERHWYLVQDERDAALARAEQAERDLASARQDWRNACADRDMAIRRAEVAEGQRDAARKALEYASCKVDGYESTFDRAYGLAGARCAHGEWYWPTGDTARAKEQGK